MVCGIGPGPAEEIAGRHIRRVEHEPRLLWQVLEGGSAKQEASVPGSELTCAGCARESPENPALPVNCLSGKVEEDPLDRLESLGDPVLAEAEVLPAAGQHRGSYRSARHRGEPADDAQQPELVKPAE